MNHIYRSIWSSATGTCVATSEHVSGSGKAVSASSEKPVTRLRCHKLSGALMLVFGALAQASPTGGVVTSGRASIGGTPGQMTVTQTTASAAINWQSFGIRAGESVQFVQPSSSSVALNRVVGSDPSAILGSLSSNGKVFLVNPSGILFGPGASVNVGGLVASTLNISDADFMAGRYRFSGSSTGSVVNQGLIQAADGGYVALLASQVSNQGRVVAQLGTVALAAGQAMTLDVSGDQLLNVAIDQGVANALLSNGGLLQADGGKVLMTTQVAGNLLANAVNNTGVVQAQSLAHRNGSVYLLGSMESGTVNVGGTLDVSGGPGQAGGRVVATAHHVGLFNAQIQASGDTGGGVVLVGGDYQGQNPAVPHAAAVYMSADSAIHADARVQGDGGKIVLWSDGSTRAHGQVSARGGDQSGNGGLIETSGHGLSVAGIAVDTRAARGQTGTWLLDPADVTISSAATSDAVATGGVYAPNSGVNSANVNVADLVTALGGTNVTVTTTNTGVSGGGLGDIHVDAAITWTAPTTLHLTAARDVNIHQAVTGTGGSLAVNAGRDIVVGATVTTTSGHLAFTAGQDVQLNAAATITTGNLTAVAGRHVNVAAASTVTTGDMVFRADNDGTGPGVPAGTVNITCGASCLTVTTGVLSVRFNPASYGSTNSEILAYSGKLTGGGTLDAKAWVFGLGDNKIYDGTTAANVSGLMPDVTSVAPPVTLVSVSNANFDTKHVGADKPITFTSTFADASYDLFATSSMPAGTYQALADVLVRPLTVTAATDTRAYNGTTSSVGVPTATDLQAGDTLGGTLTQVFASKDVLGTGNSTLIANGAYTVSDGNGGNNYAVSVVTAPGTITPAALTVTAQDVSKVYGQVPVLTGFTTTALVNGETVGSVSLTSAGQAATATVADGPYAITPSNAVGGTFAPGNYSISYVNGALNITPAALTVTAQDVSKVYGQVPVLTGFTTTALVNGETVGSVTLSSSGQPASAGVAGSPYVITPSNAVGGTFAPGNYSISYINGALTVVPPVIVPPVEPPVLPPVEPPVLPPVVPPVEPPVLPPVEPPVLPPVEPPVLPPVEPPVLPPVVPPVEPPVLPPVEPPVTPIMDVPLLDSEHALPTVPVLDPKPAWLTIAPMTRVKQGPVIFPPSPAPFAAPVTLLPPPVIEMVQVHKEVTAPAVPVLPATPVVPLRPRKQDRN
jgi:filamentous hemagglutinin family protein